MDLQERNKMFLQRNFVTNFIEFGALQRIRTSWMLLEQFDRAEGSADRASAALGIFQNLLNQYEDTMLWLQVVLDWRDATTSVTRLIEEARFRTPNLRYYRTFETNPTKMADFRKKLEWQDLLNSDASGPGFARRIAVPYFDEAYDADGFSQLDRRWLRVEIDALASLKWRFLSETRRYLDAALDGTPHKKSGYFEQWPIWNKLKHGLFATLTEREDRRGVVLNIHLDPDRLGNASEVEVDAREIYPMVAKTFMGGQFIGRLLAVVSTIRYLPFIDDRTPGTPDAPWLTAAREMSLEPISRADLERVIRAVRVPNQRLHVHLAPNSLSADGHVEAATSPRPYWVEEIKLGADWWKK